MILPLVSVCIPTYNGATYLKEALDSILVQDYRNIEVIISDDDSNDNTWAIAEHFSKTAPFPVRMFRHVPTSIGANWNFSLQKATGTYVKFLFQDDVLLPDCIRKMTEFLEDHSEYQLIACKRDFIIEGDKTSEVQKWLERYEDLQRIFFETSNILSITSNDISNVAFLKDPKNKIGEPSTTLFKRSLLEEVGYFNEDLKQILDYVFYYRVLKKYPIAILPEKLIKFRIHPAQATNMNRNQDISDYERYDRILYSEFLSLLHPHQQDRLKAKYRIGYPVFKKIKRKLFGK